MPRRNAPENFFPAVRGCPRSCARTNPWFRGRTLPVPGHGGGGRYLRDLGMPPLTGRRTYQGGDHPSHCPMGGVKHGVVGV